MKTRILCGLAAAAAVLALPAQANSWFHRHHDANRTTYDSTAPVTPMADGSPIHTAANNPDDQMIADHVADALRSDRGLNGARVTVAVNEGRVSLAGVAANRADAYRVENIARAAAGPGRVVAGSIDSNG
jgi:osmotically-inducible protein OsmY